VVSREVHDQTLRLDPTLAGRLTTVPYGVPVPDEIPPKADGGPLKLVYAGRLVEEQKRVLDLPRVVAACEARGVPVELTVIGGGADAARLEEACRALRAPGSVRFLGTLPNPDVLRELERSDVFILTSAYEGLPVALLEAMARGCVPVVTRIRSGVSECVRDGENGFLVPVGDSAAFADRLAALHADPNLLHGLAAAARSAIRGGGYDVDTMVKRYADLFGRTSRDAASGAFVRPKGRIRPPSYLKYWWIRRLRHRVVGSARWALGLDPNG
jgi:glycosyltransferase involved in cell wall biosynthesis